MTCDCWIHIIRNGPEAEPCFFFDLQGRSGGLAARGGCAVGSNTRVACKEDLVKRYRRSVAFLVALVFSVTSPGGLLVQVALAQQARAETGDPGELLSMAAVEIQKAFMVRPGAAGFAGQQALQGAVQRGRAAVQAARQAVFNKMAQIQNRLNELVQRGREAVEELSEEVRQEIQRLAAELEELKARVKAGAQLLVDKTEAGIRRAVEVGAAAVHAAVEGAKVLLAEARDLIRDTAYFVVGLGIIAVEKVIAATKAAVAATREALHKAKERLKLLMELAYLKALQAAGYVKVKVGQAVVFVRDRIIEVAAILVISAELTVEAIKALIAKTQQEIAELKEAISKLVNRAVAAGKAAIQKLAAEIRELGEKLKTAAAAAKAAIIAGIQRAKEEVRAILQAMVDFAVVMVAIGAIVVDEAIAAVRAVSHKAVALAKAGVEAVRRGLVQLKNDIKLVVQAAARKMAELKAKLKELEQKIIDGVIELTEAVFEQMVVLKAKIISIGKATVAMIRNAFYATVGLIVIIGEKIKEEIGEAVEVVREFFRDLEDAIEAAAERLAVAFEKLKTAVGAAAAAIKAEIQATIEALAYVLERTMEAVANVGYTITGLALMAAAEARAAVEALKRELERLREVLRQANQMGRQAWGAAGAQN